jgi:hypothetical protein
MDKINHRVLLQLVNMGNVILMVLPINVNVIMVLPDQHVAKVVDDFVFKQKMFILVIASSLVHSCGLSIETGYYIDPSTKCSSVRRLRMTKCIGECSSLSNNDTLSSCCKPVEPKRRYFRMTCASGYTYRQSLDFFKQCKCSTTVC